MIIVIIAIIIVIITLAMRLAIDGNGIIDYISICCIWLHGLYDRLCWAYDKGYMVVK